MNMIKALREQQNLSQADLAERIGTSQPQINRLEHSKRKLSKEWAERLAPALATKPEVLLFGPPDEAEVANSSISNVFELPNATIRGKLEGLGRKIPVYGQAVGGIDGEFIMNGSILYEVMAPPILSHISGAYAVSISGDSMFPRYADGEIAFIDPKRRVKKGDYVVAQIRLEEHGPLLAYVKRYLRHTGGEGGELVLDQFNPVKELRFPANTVHSVHFIALAGMA